VAIIEPFGLSKEERQKFHELLDRLTEVIAQEGEQPNKPTLRLLPPSGSEIIMKTPEDHQGENAGEQETLRAVTQALLLMTKDAVTALNQLMSDIPSREQYDFPVWLASAQAIIEQAEALVPTLHLIK